MEKAIIETRAGYCGLAWAAAGLVVLNLPSPTPYDAEIELNAALESLGKRAVLGAADQCKYDLKLLEKDLNSYFEGKTVSLSFPVDWRYYTDFQAKVLQRVSSIPWGELVSYGQIAAETGNPRGSRAVGGAVGSNRVLLVVPCHRVIAHNGKIGGFGGGLGWKKRLLGLEGVVI
ncbi:MAG: methylated-DNA--[protein]-cysteine S-methyltransferase [Desulfocucumaceae bacterium]